MAKSISQRFADWYLDNIRAGRSVVMFRLSAQQTGANDIPAHEIRIQLPLDDPNCASFAVGAFVNVDLKIDHSVDGGAMSTVTDNLHFIKRTSKGFALGGPHLAQSLNIGPEDTGGLMVLSIQTAAQPQYWAVTSLICRDLHQEDIVESWYGPVDPDRSHSFFMD